MRKHLSDSDVLKIVEHYKEGLGCGTIANKIGTSRDIVRAVLRGRNYKKITGGRIMSGRRIGGKSFNG